MNTQDIDVTELRDLIRYMDGSQREDLRRALFDGESDLSRLCLHELKRVQALTEKLVSAWPYCGGFLSRLSLLELLAALSDEEARDFLNLYRWAQGDERPPGYRHVADTDFPVNRVLEREYRSDQPLSEAQRIIREVKP